MSELVELSDAEFGEIATLVHTRFGIDLTRKRSLIRGRLNGTLRSAGYRSFEQYMQSVREDSSGTRLLEMIDRLSTNHTFFFRESDHFDYLADRALPELFPDVHRSLQTARIWCAACSTGEEPYSVLITLADRFGMGAIPKHPLVLATDISTAALRSATEARYAAGRIPGVDDLVRRGLLQPTGTGEVTVAQALRNAVLFRRLNLMRDEFPFREHLDVVFCRNVMIYFDLPTRRALVARFARCLRPGGYLFLGHSESMGRSVESFEYLEPAVYRRKR